MSKARYCQRCEQPLKMWPQSADIWHHTETYRCPVTSSRFVTREDTTTEVGEDLPLEHFYEG